MMYLINQRVFSDLFILFEYVNNQKLIYKIIKSPQK